MTLAGVPAHAALTDGLIAYYPFNGNANDESGNGNNGTVNGATLTADRFGNTNGAYDFNGADSYILIGDPVPASLQIQNEITLSAWIYMSSFNPDQLYCIVGSQYDGTVSGATIFLDGRTNPDLFPSPAGHIHFQIGNGYFRATDSKTVVPMQQWVHIVATRKANENAKIYYNGVLQSSDQLWSWAGNITYTGAWFAIGRQKDYSRLFDGLIDDVRVYNRAISADEVVQLYQETNTPIATAPAVSTDAPSLITATSAILKGTVNPNGADTIVNFDFGATTAYGQSLAAIPQIIAATATATSVSAAKTGLTCGTTYHYRVTAVNSVGPTNGADKAFTTTACPRDLIVTNITLNPAKPVAGTAFSAVVTVKNQGTVATAASKLKLWSNLATVPVCTTAAPKMADITALAAGASVNVTVPGLTSNLVGSNTFRAFADGTCIIGETNETNNQRTLSYRIGGRLPDLIITSITLTPASPARNAVFNAAITVKNQGTYLGSGFLDVWTNQATTQTCGAVGDTWADVGALAAGASKIINVTGLSAGATAGAKTLRAFVDSWCETVEGNEGNNQLIKTYTVQ